MHNQTKFVDPSVYTEDYYLSDCTGFEEYKQSYGDKFEPRFKEIIKYFKINQGMKLLDIGCGRGELVFFAAKHGAEATGIDYSKEAIRLANILKNKKSIEIRRKMKFYVMDAKKLKFPNSFYDTVILTDVIEHLYDEELDILFKELKRVLKKSGILIVHTAPNKLFFDIGYKFYSYPISSFIVGVWNFIAKSHYPNVAKPSVIRTNSHAIMHVNEPTFFSLERLFRKHGFVGSVISSNVTSKKPIFGIKDLIFNFIVFLHPFSKYFPFNIVFGSDFISVLRNKK